MHSVHNNGDGTFSDVTEKAGVAAPGWASSAVWFDYDNDGRLDLFVCNFVDFNKAKNLNCVAYNKPGYCVPTLYKPAASWLFHNNGHGTFTDVSQSSGIAKRLGKAFHNDGKLLHNVSGESGPLFARNLSSPGPGYWRLPQRWRCGRTGLR